MLKYFIKNKKAIMGLTLSQLGLIIASGILIAAVYSIIFQNDWQQKAEMENIATSFSTMIEAMDTRFFENITSYTFAEKNYHYDVSISTEYITVTANTNNLISIKQRFLVRPWPQKTNTNWITGEELHTYLKNTFGNQGSLNDPIRNITNVKNYLNTQWNKTCKSLANSPLNIIIIKPIYLEKTCIYYSNDEKQDLILVYQK